MQVFLAIYEANYSGVDPHSYKYLLHGHFHHVAAASYVGGANLSRVLGQ